MGQDYRLRDSKHFREGGRLVKIMTNWDGWDEISAFAEIY